jgi:hypothetical protein
MWSRTIAASHDERIEGSGRKSWERGTEFTPGNKRRLAGLPAAGAEPSLLLAGGTPSRRFCSR